MPGIFDLEIYRNDSTDPINFTFTALPGNITAMKMEIRPFRGSDTITRTLSSTGGEFVITDPAAATATLNSYQWTDPAGTYVHDIELTLTGAQPTFTILTGSFTVTQDVTNA
jgi:hypothetical protein